MDENSAESEQADATPIFAAFRRGYDPDQVNRYVADQSRRLDEAMHRASEAERKLAAAVGQLRELHRRVAVLENDERSPQPGSLDTLGERVQRVLQEAWEGAYALRQEAEREVAEQKDLAVAEGEEVVAKARRKAEAIEEEIERRRRAYLERIEADRSRAAAQMTFLHEQRKLAVSELERVKVLIETTVAEVSDDPDARAAREMPDEAEALLEAPEEVDTAPPDADADADADVAMVEPSAAPPLRALIDDDLPSTMPVHRMAVAAPPIERPDAGELVHSHRGTAPDLRPQASSAGYETVYVTSRPTVFDFEQQDGDNQR